jgi:hypothetical protein
LDIAERYGDGLVGNERRKRIVTKHWGLKDSPGPIGSGYAEEVWLALDEYRFWSDALGMPYLATSVGETHDEQRGGTTAPKLAV